MKKRILFVDDESLVLQGLQRTLRPMRQDWEMDFAEGGAKALERVATSAYDVVVSDMLMPGMDGAQLLQEIQQKSPQTIRLILSGHAEQRYSMKCVGVAHQYLSKPCDPAALKNTLLRLTSLDSAGHNECILKLLPSLERLPSIPAVYSEIVRLLNDPDSSLEEVGAVIAKDMAITAQILRVVNSSFFGMPRRISDPTEAASYLGMETLTGLVLAANVFSEQAATIGKSFSVEALSQHSQQVGAAARIIAKSEQAPQSVVNDSVLAGFLHDTGKLILVANLPEQFHQARRLVTESGQSPLDAERKIFGATHAEVGGYLLGLWGLPEPVVEAIALHHAPATSPGKAFSPLAAVHVANALVWERDPALPGNERPAVDLNYLASLGLADRLPCWRSAVEQSFAGTSHQP